MYIVIEVHVGPYNKKVIKTNMTVSFAKLHKIYCKFQAFACYYMSGSLSDLIVTESTTAHTLIPCWVVFFPQYIF
jgi:hypothetical protein